MTEKLTACKDCEYHASEDAGGQYPDRYGDGGHPYVDYCTAEDAANPGFNYLTGVSVPRWVRCKDINTNGKCPHFKEKGV